MAEVTYEFDPHEEYLFYPGPLSRQSSFETMFLGGGRKSEIKRNKALYDPNVRKQVAKLQPKRPYFLLTISSLQILLLLYSMYLNYLRNGSFIQLTPTVNYLIGPSQGILIDMGARYIPCMKTGTGFDIPSDAYFPCPFGIKGTHRDGGCYLSQVCSMNGLIKDPLPNQWFRFFSACGLHGGVIHILLNLSFQVQGGFDLEKDMGWWRMALIYLISGSGGFMFGASLSDVTAPSVGASGSLYGMIACLFLDLLQNWTIIKSPWWELVKMILNITLSLGIGTLPYIDNNAHVGGFIFGICSGLLIMPKIYYGKWDRRVKKFFMYVSIPVGLVLGYLFLNNFYTGYNFCTGCKYFNCIPGMPWCDQKWAVGTFFNSTTLLIQ